MPDNKTDMKWLSKEYRFPFPKREDLHDLGLQFRSPFVNLWLTPKDFIKLLGNLEYYMEMPLAFIHEEAIEYPVGLLKDVKIYFQHYESEDEALMKWNERKQRINYDNLFILFKENGKCTKDDLAAFDRLNFKNKIVFTHQPYPDIKSSFYIRGFENEGKVGDCFSFMPDKPYMKYYDQFDYVKWFNSEIKNGE